MNHRLLNRFPLLAVCLVLAVPLMALAQAADASQSAASSFSACPHLTRSLKPGSSGEDVRALQLFLVQDPSIYPEGTISGYYGALTRKAVERFQVKYDIVSSGSPETTGFGVAGMHTRAAISQLCKNNVSSAPAIPATSSGSNSSYGGTQCSNADSANAIGSTTWKYYRNDQFGFEFQYPPELSLNESSDQYGLFVQLVNSKKTIEIDFSSILTSAGEGPGLGDPILWTKPFIITGITPHPVEDFSTSIIGAQKQQVYFFRIAIGGSQFFYTEFPDNPETACLSITKTESIARTFRFRSLPAGVSHNSYTLGDMTFDAPPAWRVRYADTDIGDPSNKAPFGTSTIEVYDPSHPAVGNGVIIACPPFSYFSPVARRNTTFETGRTFIHDGAAFTIFRHSDYTADVPVMDFIVRPGVASTTVGDAGAVCEAATAGTSSRAAFDQIYDSWR